MLISITKGFSLVESLIAMTLGLVSIGALAALIGQSIGLSSQSMLRAQLDQHLSDIVAMMQSDLQRSSGVAGEPNEPLDSKVFRVFEDQFVIGHYPGEAPQSCVLFAYDINGNGKLDHSNPNERLGFRLKDYSVEIRQDGASCEQNGWQDISDPHLTRVIQLRFISDQDYPQTLGISVQAKAKANKTFVTQLAAKVRMINHGL